MGISDWAVLDWLALVEHELLLFAGVFFLLGAIDEVIVDLLWLRLRVAGQHRTIQMPVADLPHRPLTGRAAVLIPAWQEEKVIEYTIAHALKSWTQAELCIYVGCYRNDPATVEAAARGAGFDPRVRLVIHDKHGPTTKADCLNRLYVAMEQDEGRTGEVARMVLLHDAEDMVAPPALSLLDKALELADFVQLPVLPMPHPKSRWIGSHYCEEFAEAHGKAMVVRDSLPGGIPAAGVGCAFSRDLLSALARQSATRGPFCEHSLVEDYELGLRIAEAGGRSRFLRVRGPDRQLVATRAFFPSRLDHSVRQKARWVHGIAFQGWDRVGWGGSLAEWWMRGRDRRGPLAAVVLLAGYALLALAAVLWIAGLAGIAQPRQPGMLLQILLWFNVASFIWRAAMRFAFTSREYGWAEGVRAVFRIPLTNIIAIMAGRRALLAYIKSLFGARPAWDKTSHDAHPAQERSVALQMVEATR